MSEITRLKTPLTKADVLKLKAGRQVLITGPVFAARDIAHQRLCRLIDENQPLPIDIEGAVAYFVGPTPARPGRVIGAAGPTTSCRMDAFSPKLIANGLRAMIGKGYRTKPVIDALKKYGAVHFATIGGAGALLSTHIVAARIVAYEDLAAEAIRQLSLVDFPAVVAYDAHGGTIYDR